MNKMKHRRAGRLGPLCGALKREEGFTLTELMVFIGIMIIFLIGIAGMIESGVKSSVSSYNLVRIEESASEALSTITRQVRVATAVSANSTGSMLSFSGDLSGDGTPDTMVYTVTDGNLMVGPSLDNMQIWMEGADLITFTYYEYDEDINALVTLTPGNPADWNTLISRVDIELVFSKEAMGIDIERSYSGSVTLRNRL